jgi:hypothetical protein
VASQLFFGIPPSRACWISAGQLRGGSAFTGWGAILESLASTREPTMIRFAACFVVSLLATPVIAEPTETAGVELLQVPLQVSGRGDLERLSTDDVEVWIGDRRLDRFYVDVKKGRSTVHAAGNWAAGYRSWGPFRLDSTPPDSVT